MKRGLALIIIVLAGSIFVGCGDTPHTLVEKIAPGVYSICNYNTGIWAGGGCNGGFEPGIEETCEAHEEDLLKIKDGGEGVVIVVCKKT